VSDRSCADGVGPEDGARHREGSKFGDKINPLERTAGLNLSTDGLEALSAAVLFIRKLLPLPTICCTNASNLDHFVVIVNYVKNL